MVLESLVSLKQGIRNPWSAFYLSAIVSLISFSISFVVFKEDVGLYSVILTTLGLTPFMTKLNIYEGKISLVRKNGGILDLLFFYAKDKKSITKMALIVLIPFLLFSLFYQKMEFMLLMLFLYFGVFLLFSLVFLSFYREIISCFIAVFAGITLVFSLLYLILPPEISSKTFRTQIDEIRAIRGYFWFGGTFQTIFINNVGVLFLSFLFSFIYGSGAIFILAWNASILATAASMLAQSLGGITKLPIALLSYMPHGSLEIVAYFLAAVAGGILSYYFTRGIRSKVVIEDCLFLLSLGMIFLLLGATVETAALMS